MYTPRMIGTCTRHSIHNRTVGEAVCDYWSECDTDVDAPPEDECCKTCEHWEQSVRKQKVTPRSKTKRMYIKGLITILNEHRGTAAHDHPRRIKVSRKEMTYVLEDRLRLELAREIALKRPLPLELNNYAQEHQLCAAHNPLEQYHSMTIAIEETRKEAACS